MSARIFTDEPATRQGHLMPLIIGITAPSGAGKTYSALRLATGILRVTGGEIFGIDTESDRMRHYSDYFKFRHVPLDPPHSSLDYRGAIDHCIGRGARVIIIDQMSSEHDGDGGVLDQMEEFLERKAGDDEGKRHKLLMASCIRPKREQKKLTRHIVELGKRCIFIILYRAEDKIKPRKGGEPDRLGWQPITTSTLPYEMTVRFLLPLGSDGVPMLVPATPAERLCTKNPEQFRGWFKAGEPLCEEMGERMARWASGETATPAPPPSQGPPAPQTPPATPKRSPSNDEEWKSAFRLATSPARLNRLLELAEGWYKTYTSNGVPLEVYDVYNSRLEEFAEQEAKHNE